MTCKFCVKDRPVKWWAKPAIGPESEMCDPCLRRVGMRDAGGAYLARPIDEHRKEHANDQH